MMPKDNPDQPDILNAYNRYNRQIGIRNIQVGCFLGMALMPAGVILDFAVYPEEVGTFFLMRILCSFLIFIFWRIVISPAGRRYYRVHGVILAMFPSVCISSMIYMKDGFESPYYAGLNLVMLVVGFVLQWSFYEGFTAAGLIMAMYLLACFGHSGYAFDRASIPYAINNLYFLLVTVVIMVSGNYYASKLRLREFTLRFQLDRNREELEESNKKLVELDQIKSRFFANISHELRTPLTLLLAPLEAIQRGYAQHFDDQVREWLWIMQSNGMRLLKLINDLLDLVRLDSGKMEIRREPTIIDDFVKGLIQSIKKVAQDKGVNLSSTVEDEIGMVLMDREKLEKILLNLLFNAIKFTPAGGSVRLHVDLEGEDLVFSVSDTGMGISEKDKEQLFTRFWQADTSAQRKYQGTGIGLALVKELVEVQGGSVEVQSEQGQGTEMKIKLPRIPAVSHDGTGLREEGSMKSRFLDGVETEFVPGIETKEPEWLSNLFRRAEMFPSMTSLKETVMNSGAYVGRKNARLVIADDEPDMLRFLKSQLGSYFEIIEAVDGVQAVQLASQYQPDAIICDMMMPEKDGLEVTRDLRAQTHTRNIPILLLTARADEMTKIEALELGAHDFLSKPFSTTELFVRVKNMVESFKMQNQVARQNRILESTLEQLKETETQLVQSEKLASLGRLSAGIIHEINNPLNYASTGLYTLRHLQDKMQEEEREDFTETLDDIGDGIRRVQTIVSDLRSFAHPDQVSKGDVDIGGSLDKALRFLGKEWETRIKVIREVPEGFSVWANESQIIQILVNMLQNAFDALEKRPIVDGQDGLEVRVTGFSERGEHFVVIRDNGPGIAHENQANIFDPFYTTKEIGKGMGLGLSICYRIMDNMGGRIEMKTEPGCYCEFKLAFLEKQSSIEGRD